MASVPKISPTTVNPVAMGSSIINMLGGIGTSSAGLRPDFWHPVNGGKELEGTLTNGSTITKPNLDFALSQGPEEVAAAAAAASQAAVIQQNVINQAKAIQAAAALSNFPSASPSVASVAPDSAGNMSGPVAQQAQSNSGTGGINLSDPTTQVLIIGGIVIAVVILTSD
jgi:hypothetical protein